MKFYCISIVVSVLLGANLIGQEGVTSVAAFVPEGTTENFLDRIHERTEQRFHFVYRPVEEFSDLTPISQESPVFPDDDDIRYPGLVRCAIVVSEEGETLVVAAYETTDERLSKACFNAIEQWTFNPAIIAGSAEVSMASIAIPFVKESEVERCPAFPASYDQKRVSFEEFEAAMGGADTPPEILDILNNEAEIAKEFQDIPEGAELWFWSSPWYTWQRLMGRQGYAIVQDGEIIHSMVTLIN